MRRATDKEIKDLDEISLKNLIQELKKSKVVIDPKTFEAMVIIDNVIYTPECVDDILDMGGANEKKKSDAYEKAMRGI